MQQEDLGPMGKTETDPRLRLKKMDGAGGAASSLPKNAVVSPKAKKELPDPLPQCRSCCVSGACQGGAGARSSPRPQGGATPPSLEPLLTCLAF